MTQQELDGLLARVIGQARQAGIPVSPAIEPAVRINRRARTRFGCCRRENGRYLIEVAAALLGAETHAVCQVLAHEVLHTCPGCADHGPRWKGWAARMNACWGYDIQRADTYDRLGLTDDRQPRYVVVCRRCGREIPRMKRSPMVAHPERYRCRCGGALYVRLPDPPPENGPFP